MTLDNYDTALRAGDLPPPGFAKNFVNTFIITIPSSILPIIIAAVAYALAWMKFKGRDWIFLGVVAMLVVSRLSPAIEEISASDVNRGAFRPGFEIS